MSNINIRYSLNDILKYLLYFISFTILIDKSPITIAGSYVRLYQIASVFFILGTGYLLINKKLKIEKDLFILMILLWFIVLIISGINAVFFKAYLKAIIGQAYLLCFAYCVYIYMTNNTKVIDNSYKCFIYGLIFGVLVGIVQFLVYISLGINIGVTHMNLGLARPIGLMRETNWYALVCLIVSIPMMIHYFSMNYFINKKSDLTLLLLSLIGMFLSMTRTAFLAFVVTYLFAYILLKFNKQMLRFSIAVIVIGVMCISIMFIINPDKIKGYAVRLNPFQTAKTDNGALSSRSATMKLSLDKFKEHPLIGNGAGTIGVLANSEHIRTQYAGGGELNTINAGPNIFVNLFYESGLLGATVFLLAFYVFAKKLYIKYRYDKDNYIIIIWITSLIGIITFSMFNNSIRFGVFWFIIAYTMTYLKDNKMAYINS